MEAQLRKLVRELKLGCVAHGDRQMREKAPKKSSIIFHKMGKIYQSKAEATKDLFEKRICLIRSAALLNAAVVRRPANLPEILKDLESLCSCVLAFARANKIMANLRKMASNFKESIVKMRNMVSKTLKNLDRKVDSGSHYVAAVEMLQDNIHQIYTSTMRAIMDFCIDVMGPSPCSFALVGMGSLARKEITPYSDFEHIYVLEEGVYSETTLEYFRWLAVVFQIVLINMGETILPHVSLPYMNDYRNEEDDWFYDAFTVKGVCFDGMVPFACKHPLGRPETENRPWKVELIKPLSEMLLYLKKDEDLKNGYHLADMLTRTCYVSGSLEIYEEFEYEAKSVFLWEWTPQQVHEMVKNDLKNFDSLYNISVMSHSPTFNTKRVIYRSVSIFIAALGRIHRLKECSSFDIIRELMREKVVALEFGEKLLLAVANACEIRLCVYLNSESCQDSDARGLDDLSQTDLLDLLGAENGGNFFASMTQLQQLVRDRLDIGDKNAQHRVTCIRILFHLAFGSQQRALSLCRIWYKLEQLWLRWLTKVDFTARSCGLPTDHEKVAAELIAYISCFAVTKMLNEFEHQPLSTVLCLNIATRYAKLGCYSSAKTYFRLLQKSPALIHYSNDITEVNSKEVLIEYAIAYYATGISLYHHGFFNEAAIYLEKADAIRLRIKTPATEKQLDKCCSYLGHCYYALSDHVKALEYFDRSNLDCKSQQNCSHYQECLAKNDNFKQTEDLKKCLLDVKQNDFNLSVQPVFQTSLTVLAFCLIFLTILVYCSSIMRNAIFHNFASFILTDYQTTLSLTCLSEICWFQISLFDVFLGGVVFSGFLLLVLKKSFPFSLKPGLREVVSLLLMAVLGITCYFCAILSIFFVFHPMLTRIIAFTNLHSNLSLRLTYVVVDVEVPPLGWFVSVFVILLSRRLAFKIAQNISENCSSELRLPIFDAFLNFYVGTSYHMPVVTKTNPSNFILTLVSFLTASYIENLLPGLLPQGQCMALLFYSVHLAIWITWNASKCFRNIALFPFECASFYSPTHGALRDNIVKQIIKTVSYVVFVLITLYFICPSVIDVLQFIIYLFMYKITEIIILLAFDGLHTPPRN